jgi:anti-sigma regulatory factor (Ser/Thr protein kinase)
MKGEFELLAEGEGNKQIAYRVGPHGLEVSFPSELHLAGEVIQAATAYGRQFGVNPYRLSIVLRELLRNAIEHGNDGDCDRVVTCTVACESDDSLRVTVRDEGQGFDFSQLDYTLPENGERLEQRGFILVNAYAARLAFNDTGNEISAYLQRPTELMVLEHG